ncbi:transposase domain protein [Rickettsia hoogstraalii str. RCCE3]|nr:transposase domain protein [Rickettsia hoogstraalii str. RCCE3]
MLYFPLYNLWNNLHTYLDRANSVFKSLYLAIDYMTKKWSMPIPNWNAAMAHFLIKFEERI